jgi:hypothetical protein
MKVVSIGTQVLIVAAYLLAGVLPALAMTESHQQSRVEHAQMMAIAGHMMQLPASDMPEDDKQQMLCQQHCLFAAATLPVLDSVTEASQRFNDVQFGIELLGPSRTIPPPGRPPKVHVI